MTGVAQRETENTGRWGWKEEVWLVLQAGEQGGEGRILTAVARRCGHWHRDPWGRWEVVACFVLFFHHGGAHGQGKGEEMMGRGTEGGGRGLGCQGRAFQREGAGSLSL